jgi:hypothetical protein
MAYFRLRPMAEGLFSSSISAFCLDWQYVQIYVLSTFRPCFLALQALLSLLLRLYARVCADL